MFLQSSRGKGIFIRIRTWEHTKAAIVGSLMGMLSTSRQSCLLSWVFTTLSQPAGIWKLRGNSIFFFFFDPCPDAPAFISLSALKWTACCLRREKWNQSQWLEWSICRGLMVEGGNIKGRKKVEEKVKFTITKKKVVGSVFAAGAVASSSSFSSPRRIILSLFTETELLL